MITDGFHNSINGDRRYDAREMSAIFDGIINDGVFMSVGQAFAVNAVGGMEVTVGTGRGWFNSTWIKNDAVMKFNVSPAHVVMGRVDVIVIEIDGRTEARRNSIKYIQGVPAAQPSPPAMIHTDRFHQYPLCQITVLAESTDINQSGITNLIGLAPCPFVTGILETLDITMFVAQLHSQWGEWLNDRYAQMLEWLGGVKNELDAQFMDWFINYINSVAEYVGDLSGLETNNKTTIVDAMNEVVASMRLLSNFVSSTLGGGTMWASDLLQLSNVAITEGVWNESAGTVSATGG